MGDEANVGVTVTTGAGFCYWCNCVLYCFVCLCSLCVFGFGVVQRFADQSPRDFDEGGNGVDEDDEDRAFSAKPFAIASVLRSNSDDSVRPP